MKVSVVLCAHNEQEHIAECLHALLEQTFVDFEIVIIDDHSSDRTGDIIGGFRDQRIRCYRNDRRCDSAKSCNRGLSLSQGDYVFLTDADCRVAKDWIEQGLKVLESSDLVGVEGRVVLVSEGHQPTYSDSMIGDLKPGQYRGPSIAYRRRIIDCVSGFDEEFTYFNDRALALRVLRAGGRIGYSEMMIAYHPPIRLSVKEYLATAKNVKNIVRLYKDFHDKQHILWRIVYPRNLVAVFLPPTVLFIFLLRKFRSWDDIKLVPFIYLRLVYERLCLWRQCIKARVFLI